MTQTYSKKRVLQKNFFEYLTADSISTLFFCVNLRHLRHFDKLFLMYIRIYA